MSRFNIDWEVLRHVANWRVVRNLGPKTEYHRGSNGAVRVYSELEAAENRAAKLNAQEARQ